MPRKCRKSKAKKNIEYGLMLTQRDAKLLYAILKTGLGLDVDETDQSLVINHLLTPTQRIEDERRINEDDLDLEDESLHEQQLHNEIDKYLSDLVHTLRSIPGVDYHARTKVRPHRVRARR